MDQPAEDMIIARAAELYRAWEARPWHAKVKGRMRAAWRRYRFSRNGW